MRGKDETFAVYPFLFVIPDILYRKRILFIAVFLSPWFIPSGNCLRYEKFGTGNSQ